MVIVVFAGFFIVFYDSTTSTLPIRVSQLVYSLAFLLGQVSLWADRPLLPPTNAHLLRVSFLISATQCVL